ncbi:uncharacterized protein LOC119547515 [Drosophila subpulchrella]|uniref:uncharacterized protein LOC119547515 n=1 Tax=Drosophila subpulchrella TaxID=1486046 RepID=UPI0018A1574B|nr:uncharacterized protein LOC119547515 [Drosophila subpulchrella]
MKGALVCICLALFMALYGAEYICDPDSNNKPDCTNASNLLVPIRNFYDPTRYWNCTSVSNNSAEVVKCESGGFDPTLKKCVSWETWKWTDCCP